MTFGLVELAVGVILVLVPGPGVSGLSLSLASLFVLATVDHGQLFGQLLLFYPIEVFFFLGHWSFEGRVLPSGLASRSSWVDFSTVVREGEGSPQLVVHLAGAFYQGFSLRKPCPCVQLDCLESRNKVFYRCGLLWSRAGLCSWPSLLRFPPVLRERPRVFLVLCKLAGFLKTLEYWQRDKFWDLVSRFLILCLEMLETSALGIGKDLGLLLVLEGAMTNSTYVSCFSFILIPYRLKVCDRCFAMLQGISLNPAFGKHSGLTTDVRSQNCCSCLDLISDQGVRTKGPRKYVPGKRHPPIPCFVWCWPSEISFVSI
ncbi:hypothetical protein F2Q69_00015485 [Brassica cretica]|uniref:Uncharacterized protein n=1 Tax=Brassica cretica TaxID=69181 RepID=A0A8S9QW42_BRACR|nr:hypothetical protein F2Q69_00015485 [Brassica cretica]